VTSDSLLGVDTSLAVPLLVASHPEHARVGAWAKDRMLGLCGHALVETYAVLTRLPGDARVAASDATKLIDDNFAVPLVLSARVTRDAHRRLARSGVAGGACYDGLIALAAREHGVVLATRDVRARSTYEALGVTVELLATGDVAHGPLS
jgi:toxin FitB